MLPLLAEPGEEETEEESVSSIFMLIEGWGRHTGGGNEG